MSRHLRDRVKRAKKHEWEDEEAAELTRQARLGVPGRRVQNITPGQRDEDDDPEIERR